MRVIVRGNRFEAARAAADRGIPFSFYSESSSLSGDYTITSGMTADAHWHAVAQWFNEPGEAPYPIGACLHYGE